MNHRYHSDKFSIALNHALVNWLKPAEAAHWNVYDQVLREFGPLTAHAKKNAFF
jgi:hypothetical protein